MGVHIMIVNYIVGFVAAVLIGLMVWALKGVMLLPVKAGDNTNLSVIIDVDGAENRLEQTLDGLIWLRENGTLNTEIIIKTRNSDENTRHIAQKYAEYRKCITLIDYGDSR